LALAAGLSWAASTTDPRLVARLNGECLKNFTDEKPAVAKNWCDCIIRHHSRYSTNDDLKILIEVYSGSEKYSRPGVSDSISILLNNDADLVEKCEANPRWNAK
jgi:hypothetical protein